MKDDVISRHGVSAWLDNMGYPKLAEVIMDEKRFPPVQLEPHWIPCSESRPKHGVVLVTYKGGEIDLLRFPTAYRAKDIIAWMPSPEPPKLGDD